MNDLTKELILLAGVNQMNRRSDGLYVIGEDVLEKLVESVAKDCANVARISGGVLFKSEPARAEADRIFYKINHRYGMPE